MRVALTGASGFIGSSTARLLREAGHSVVALVRESSRRDHLTSLVERYVVGDQSDPSAWQQLLYGADAVVHNAADWDALRAGDDGGDAGLRRHLDANLTSAVRFLHAAHRANVQRFVFVSSVAVHHDISPRWKGLIDEDHPARPRGLYGAMKAAVEAHLWDAHARLGMHTVALRPAGVYGVEPVVIEKSHGHRALRALLDGRRVTPAEFPGGGKWVAVEDVALAIVRAVERADRPGVSGRPFHLADCYAKHTRFAEHAADILNLPDEMVEPDRGAPAKNAFDKAAARDRLGVAPDRGDMGLHEHMRRLIVAVQDAKAR